MDVFTIAFVCTGNRFRSPLAAAFVERLTRGLPVRTESYGTLRLDGAPPLPQAVDIGLACGVSLAEHRARFVDDVSLGEMDLVLGFEPAHVQQAVLGADARRDRSFLLPELVSRLPADTAGAPPEGVVEHARALIRLAGQQTSDRETLAHRGIRDPFGEPWKVHRQTAAEIRELCIVLVQELFGRFDADVLPPVPTRLRRPRKLLWR